MPPLVWNSPYSPQRLYFGAKKTEPSPAPKTQPQEAVKTDPTPRYLTRRLLQSWVLVLGGLTAGLAGPSTVGRFHTWSQQRAEQALVSPAETLSDQALDSLARTNAQLRSLPVAPTAMDYYTRFLAWDALFLAWSFRLGLFRRSIRPQALWKELNEQGITGKGMKIAVVDCGVLPTRSLPAEKISYQNSQGKPLPLKDRLGHGTAIASMMAAGSPDSTVTVLDPFVHEPGQKNTYFKQLDDFFAKGQADPSTMTVSALRELFREDIAGISQSVMTAVDQGNTVVTVSLNLEAALQSELRTQYRLVSAKKKLQRWLSPSRLWNPKAYQARMERYEAYGQRLIELLAQRTVSSKVDDSILALYAPWRKALDYAAAHGVPVFLSAGNGGTHFSPLPDALGQANMLAITDHPALMVIASANHRGEVSDFTSEMNDQVRPLAAGNGSGELDTETAVHRGWLSRMYTPMWAFGRRASVLRNSGTSFAVPDVAVLYLKMKELDPALTLEEAKAIIARTAGPASLSKKEEAAAIEQLEKRVLAKTELEATQKATQHPDFFGVLGKKLAEALPDQATLKDFVVRMLKTPPELTAEENELLGQAIQKATQALLPKETGDLKNQMTETLVQEHLKRRVGAGVVRRYAAIDALQSLKAERNQT